MRTPEKILLDLLENSGVVHATIQKYPEFERSIIKAMEEYAVQCVETASFSSERLQEIAESKAEELQEDLLTEQEQNTLLAQRCSDYADSVTRLESMLKMSADAYEDLKKAYELEQEHNISLVEELDDLKAHLKHVVTHYKGILKNDEFNCPACFKEIKSCECKQQQEEHAKNFGGI
jgi:vacuolar-type H+-ATPase subunit H